MAAGATLPPRIKQQKPTASPFEAGDIICGACGKEMTREVKMGPRAVECLIYQCINEETGCNYEIERRVPVQMYTGPRGIKEDKK